MSAVGPLPTGWVATSLAEIVEPRIGKADPQAQPNAKFIGMEQVEAHTMRLLGTVAAGTMKSGANTFGPGDVLYGRLRSYLNKVYQPEFSGLCSGEFIVLPATVAAHGKFLKYRLNAGDFVRFTSRINTGDRPRVDFDQIKTFDLALPPRGEQERIADALDELLSDLDAGVAALERARDKLKLYRAAILKAAVEGTITAEWRKEHPHTEPASDLLKRILTERRRRWEAEQLRKFKEKGREPPKNWKAKYKEPVAPDTTDLPPLPEGWCWATVEQLATVTSGQTPPGMPIASTQGEGVLWFRVADMNAPGNDVWMQNGGLRLSVDAAKSLGVKLLPAGSIIFPKRGGAIATNKKRRLKFDAACDLNLMAVTPVAPAGEYLWLWFLALDLAKLSDGSNVPQINNPDIVPRRVPLPPLAEQQAIVEAAEDQLSVIDHLESDLDAKLSNAQTLRQSILRDAFSGKLAPQDPADEPAVELLKRIAAEREQRAREAAVSKRLNGHKPRRVGNPRKKAARAKSTNKKEPEHGRIADR